MGDGAAHLVVPAVRRAVEHARGEQVEVRDLQELAPWALGSCLGVL